MKGSDLIKMIQERGLEDHEFCVPDRRVGIIKKPARGINAWNDALKNGSHYDTGRDRIGNGGKIATLTECDI